MLNFFKRKIKEYECRRLTKRYCEPDKDFLNTCREEFIAKVCREIPPEKAKRFSLVVLGFKYSLAVFIILVFLGSGAAVYADRANVDYAHPLYSLKRTVEAVRVELASSQQQPVLQTELAQRRLDEIKKIEADMEIISQEVSMTTKEVSVAQGTATTTKEVAASTKKITIKKKTQQNLEAEQKKRQELMTNLRNQMRQELGSVIDEIENKRVEKTRMEKLCSSVLQIMEEDEETDGDETEEKRNERWNRFQKNCGEFIKIDWNNNQNDKSQERENKRN